MLAEAKISFVQQELFHPASNKFLGAHRNTTQSSYPSGQIDNWKSMPLQRRIERRAQDLELFFYFGL